MGLQGIVARLCLCLALAAASDAAAVALFPVIVQNAGLAQPSLAANTCGTPSSIGSDGDVCDAACPFTTTTPAAPFSATRQPECGCGASHPVPMPVDQCCTSDQPGAACLPRLGPNARPSQDSFDGTSLTYWQSLPNLTDAVLAVDLLAEHEIFDVELQFDGVIPAAAVLQRSLDGVQWTDYQYYAFDCQAAFSRPGDRTLSASDDVNCISTSAEDAPSLEFAPASPARRFGKTYLQNEVMQAFARARYLRMVFSGFHTKDTAIDFITGLPIPTEPFYRVTEFAVNGRCSCNGHSNLCVPGSNGEQVCDCLHKTESANCGACNPLFNRKPWVRGTNPVSPQENECLACNCNGHALSCTYNASVDAFPASRSLGDGGVCACQDNTAGQNCETCAPFFYKNPTAPDRTASDACIGCVCDAAGITNNGDCDTQTGQCACKANVEGLGCDTCKDTFFGLLAGNADGCTTCGCNVQGTVGGSEVCDKTSGQCPCLPSNQGAACDQCKPGFFQTPGAPAGQCTACHPECSDTGCVKFGSDTLSCLGCRNAEHQGDCVSMCPTLMYPNQNGVCQTCDNQCAAGCTAAGPDASSCFQCKNFESAGICVDACPAATYSDGNQVCQACDPECNGCTGPGPTNCATCRNVNDGGSCVAVCPISKYENLASNCLACNAQCDLAVGCSGPESFDCGACENFLFEGNPNVLFDCVTVCPSGHFVSNQTRAGVLQSVCSPCDTQCALECEGPSPSECLGGCRNFQSGTTCVAACPSHTYVKAGNICDPCSATCDAARGCTGPAASECISCAADAFSMGTACVATCPLGTYPDSSQTCQACDSECLECTGPSPSQCSSCANFVRGGTTCVGACDPNFNFVTQQGTGNATMAGPSGTVCTACDVECFGGCTGPLPSQCAACRNVLFGSDCLGACPVEAFRSGNDCFACDAQCSGGCTAAGPSSCNACLAFQSGPTCVAACAPDQFTGANRLCQACNSECSATAPGCAGPSAAACNECAALRSAVDNACVAQCPVGTYPVVNATSATCQRCDAQCTGCTGPSDLECTGCLNFKLGQQCLAECPQGFHADGNRDCVQCHPECSHDCTGPATNQCVVVVPGSTGCSNLRLGATCVANCDQATFSDGTSCLPCDAECGLGGCSGPSNRECTRCENVAFDGQCLAACPNDHYPNASRVCQPCDPLCTGAPGANANATGFGANFCSGAGPAQCTACRLVQRGPACVAACDPALEFVSAASLCLPCSAECSGGCSGPGSDECGACAHLADGTNCVAACEADSLYTNVATAQCEPCNAACNTLQGSGGCPGGTGPQHCAQCLGVRQGDVCTAACLADFFPDQTATARARGGLCRACSTQCASGAGCSGPLATQCNACAALEVVATGECVAACPALTFAMGATCPACDANCLTGCTGGGAAGCVATGSGSAAAFGCRNVVHIAGASPRCLFACPTGFTPDSSGVCQACDAQCTSSGCTGLGPQFCVACRNKVLFETFASGECLAACGTNRYEDDAPQPNTCKSCSPLCFGGCTGPRVDQCAGCAVAIGPADVCVAACDPGQVILSGADQDRAARCCSDQCAGYCTGPLPGQCEACKTARRNGVCVAQCEATEEPVNKECVCRTGFYKANGGVCTPCHEQCEGGCSGSGPRRCAECRAFQDSDESCVAACSAFSLDGDCVDNCPDDRFFLRSFSDRECVALCDSTRVFYNDTRDLESGLPLTPQLCVEDCSLLSENGVERNFRAAGDTATRCSSQVQASTFGGSDDRQLGTGFLVLIIVLVVLAVLVLLGVAYWWARRRDEANISVVPQTHYEDPNAKPRSGVPVTDFGSGGGGGGGGGGGRDSYSFDPDPMYDLGGGPSTSNFIDTSFLKQDSYLELDTSSSPNPYSMSDSALFGVPGGAADFSADDLQSTHM